MITEEQRKKAIKLYKNTKMSKPEIANLTGISLPSLPLLYRKCFEEGNLTPRLPQTALKPRTPNGQGQKRVRKGCGRGKFEHKSKYSPEQEIEIMQDYYENGFSTKQLREKWGIFPKQLQRLRIKFRDKYGIKQNAPYVYQNKYKKREGILYDRECGENGRTEVNAD